MTSRYDSAGFGSMSHSYHQERASPRFVSATSRHYPGSSDRLHRLSSPSSAAFSSTSRFALLTNSSPRVSLTPSSTAVYGPKRSVSYTAGLSLGESGERHYSSYSITAKRTPFGGTNSGNSNSFTSNPTYGSYDPSSVCLHSPSSAYHRNNHHSYSSHLSSNRLINASSLSTVTRFDHGLLASTRNLPMVPSPLVMTNRSVGNSPPDSPPSKDANSLSAEEKREEERQFSKDRNDKNNGKEGNAADESSHEKTTDAGLLKKRNAFPSRGISPKSASNSSRSTTPSKSPFPTRTASVCASDNESSKANTPEPNIPFSSQISQPSFGFFTQLEKMIKMSNFDQGKFQKHVRSAVQQNETRETEGMKTNQKIERKSLAEGRKSPADNEGRSPSAEMGESPVKMDRNTPAELFQNALEQKKAHSKSLSPAPNLRREKKKEENEKGGSDVHQKKGKRWARRARTVENLMDELQRDGMGQMTPEGKKQQFLCSARNSPNKERSPKPKQQHQLLRAVPPLLLVTSPSMGGGDEDNLNEGKDNDDGAETSAVLTLTSPTEEGGGEEEEGDDYTGSSYDEDEEYSDEDYTDEEEWESDEGEWDEATVSRTLQLSGHESDFEFPFALGASVVDKSHSNVLAPPPIFTASISYDGMSDSWGGRSYSDEGTNSTSYTEPSGDEVEVGFTLVQQCAMRGSDEEFTSTTSGSYTSGTYSSSFDEEEEEGEEEEEKEEGIFGEEYASPRAVSSSRRSRSASATPSSSSGESAESVHSGEEEKLDEMKLETIADNQEKVVMEEPASTVRKSPSPMLVQLALAQHEEELEQLLEGHAMVKDLDVEELEMEEFEEQGIDGSKEIRQEETFVRAQQLRDGRTEEATRPLTGQNKPRTDFAKKAVVQPMRQEKLNVTEQKTLLAPDEQKIREEEEKKKKEEEERKMKEEEEKKKKAEEEKKKKTKEEEERKKKTKEEEERKKKTKEEEEKKKRTKEEEERKKKTKEEEEKKKRTKEEEEKKKKAEEEEKKKKTKEEEEKKKKAEEEEEKKKKTKEEEERKKKTKEEEEKKKRTKEEEEKKKKAEEEEKKKKTKEEEEKKKKAEEEEEKKKKTKEEEEKKRTKEEEEEKKKKSVEDKSAKRKSVLNMREEDRFKAEQAEKDSARQKARATGAVEEKTKQYTVKPEEDSFAYKRSKALEPKPMDEQKKRTFQPIQKPDPKAEEAFEKQMAELREQMQQGSRKLQIEFRDVSQGLKSATDEAKLKTKGEQHRTVMDKASSTFGKAEQEKRRQRELQESEAERAKREKEEKESKEREKREKEKKAAQAAQTTKPEPKRTVRRAAKETAAPQSEDAKKGEEGTTTTKAPPRMKLYWERGTRRKTEELMKFKDTPTTTVGPMKEEQQTKKGEEREGGGGTVNDYQQQQQKGDEEGQTEGKTNEKRANRRKNRKRNTRHGHRRRPFTRAPFDIDELMDWRGLDTFERMEAFFSSRGTEKRPLNSPTNGAAPAAKRRGTEAQKVWISELRDIDKLYKASELRDIKLSAGA